MKEDKTYLITKIFNNENIRTVWDKETEKYYISVVDVVGVLTNSKNPRHYWNVLKGRLKNEGNESVTNCDQLKLKASDGKYYKTDVVDIEGMFRIIESVPSKNAEPIKLWLAKLYRRKGYDEAWIAKRIKGIQQRKSLTDVWKENGITESYEYSILTDEIYKSWSGMTAKEYKEYKGLRKESLRDNMDSIEVTLADLGEEATKRLAAKQKPQGLDSNIKVAKKGGYVAKVARDELEKQLGETIISNNNCLNYQYKENNLIESK